MKRRKFLEMSGLAGAGVLAGRFIPGAPQAKRPNILFMMSDDHGYQAISCYDGRLNRTPNIDRIAQGGVRFTRSFCTNSLCAPARAVLLTGNYSHLNGVIDNSTSFDGSQVTFPKLLQKAGYRTAMFGKWHLQSSPTGFDYWNILPGQGDYYNPDMIELERLRQLYGDTDEKRFLPKEPLKKADQLVDPD